MAVVGIFVYKDVTKKEEIFITGSMAEYKTLEEMISDSALIITGEVEKIKDSKWSNPNF